MTKRTSKESAQAVFTVIKKINSLDCASFTLKDADYFDNDYFEKKGREHEINKLCKRYKVTKKHILSIMNSK